MDNTVKSTLPTKTENSLRMERINDNGVKVVCVCVCVLLFWIIKSILVNNFREFRVKF